MLVYDQDASFELIARRGIHEGFAGDVELVELYMQQGGLLGGRAGWIWMVEVRGLQL